MTVKSKRRKRKPQEIRKHHIYVIELSPHVLNIPKFLKANPNYQGGQTCFYVGMTGLTPEKRFNNHKTGHKANKYAKDFGLKLRPDLYEKYNPLSRLEAEKLEVTLARKLRERGHGVWQH